MPDVEKNLDPRFRWASLLQAPANLPRDIVLGEVFWPVRMQACDCLRSWK